MIPELVGMCRQTVRLAARTGVDGYGEPTFGADAIVRARVVGQRRLVRNDQGREVLSTHTVYLAGLAPLGAHDRITLSTGDVGSTETGAVHPDILAVGKTPDEHGRQHVVLYLA